MMAREKLVRGLVLAIAAAIVAGALTLWVGRGDALLFDLAGGIRSILCL